MEDFETILELRLALERGPGTQRVTIRSSVGWSQFLSSLLTLSAFFHPVYFIDIMRKLTIAPSSTGQYAMAVLPICKVCSDRLVVGKNRKQMQEEATEEEAASYIGLKAEL